MQKQPGVIGLDVGTHRVKAVQLVRQSKGWSSHAIAGFARREPGAELSEQEAQWIAEVLRRRGFVGNRVALCAPEGVVVSGLLDLPPESADVPRDRVVRMEMGRVHRLSQGGFACAWSALPSSSHGASSGQALCWALPHEKVLPLLSALEGAGLEMVSIEPASIALQRGCGALLSDPSRISAVADLGATSTRLVLMHKGHIVHERKLAEWSGASITEALASKWSAPLPLATHAMQRFGVAQGGGAGLLASETAGTIAGLFDEMVEQVSLSFSFVSHQYPEADLGPLLLTGGIAGMPGYAAMLSDGLELQVVPVSPGVLVEGCQDDVSATMHAAVGALGLAMKEGGAD